MAESSLVYVVDDDLTMRDLIGASLRRAGVRVETFASGEEMLEKMNGSIDRSAAAGPRCVLLDLEMPGTPGLDLLARMRAAWSSVDGAAPWPVFVITGRGSVKAAVQSMKLGAVDFVEKPFEIDTLGMQVQEALRHHADAIARAEERRVFRDRVARLSPRERELLGAIVQGQSTKMIADKLGISSRTVDHHRANVMEKMKAENVADLVRIAMGAEYQTVP
jgi:two-component system response regulator FixJ